MGRTFCRQCTKAKLLSQWLYYDNCFKNVQCASQSYRSVGGVYRMTIIPISRGRLPVLCKHTLALALAHFLTPCLSHFIKISFKLCSCSGNGDFLLFLLFPSLSPPLPSLPFSLTSLTFSTPLSHLTYLLFPSTLWLLNEIPLPALPSLTIVWERERKRKRERERERVAERESSLQLRPDPIRSDPFRNNGRAFHIFSSHFHQFCVTYNTSNK